MAKNPNQSNAPEENAGEQPELIGEIQKLNQKNEQISEANNRMRQVLEATKEEIERLRQEVEKLKAPPLPFGIYIKMVPETERVLISVDGKHYEVYVANEDLKPEQFSPGTLVLLNGALNIIDIRDNDQLGEVAKVINLMDDGRLIIKSGIHIHDH